MPNPATYLHKPAGFKIREHEFRSDRYPGGQKQFTPAYVAAGYKGYERLIKHVVKGMLPKNRLGVHLLNNLYIFDGPEHNHAAQTPKTIDINSYK